jgi:hypothetical protein
MLSVEIEAKANETVVLKMESDLEQVRKTKPPRSET